ncbi:MAG: SURF1 family protein [Candidatus Fonsibacter lacus]|uniref:SURF1-like protein n=1 Tax=Candidatus Fonsibacter lacus TaxID=2576439 RepID=A0A966HM35_9PROT|nr:SURF1 family protein [Candidatus Fonsibacter lacus]
MFRIKSLDIFFLFFILVVLSLGTWQVFRLYSKNNLISNLEKNLKKNSTNFNLDISEEYTKVFLKKKNLNFRIFLYHLYKGDIGFKVIVAYEVNSSIVVLVDKGWIKKDKINLIKNTAFNDEIIEGYTKKIKEKNFFTPSNNIKEDFSYSVDMDNLKKSLSKNIYPFLIIQTTQSNKDIIPNNYEVRLSNNHLQYAITWYGLALVTVIFFLYYRKKV